MTDLAALSCSFFTALLSDCLDAVGRTQNGPSTKFRAELARQRPPGSGE
jgi:hypothetical protein